MLENRSCRVIHIRVYLSILQELSMILEKFVVQFQDGAFHHSRAHGRDQFCEQSSKEGVLMIDVDVPVAGVEQENCLQEAVYHILGV